MPVIKQIKGRVPVKVWTNLIDEKSIQQLKNVAQLPFVHRHVAAMPDVHLGKGATIGSVIPTLGAVIPAAVGVDLGCGMMACQLDLKAEDLPDQLKAVRSAIENAVPHGRTNNGGRNDRGAWGALPESVSQVYAKIGLHRISDLLERHPKLVHKRVNAERHLGTLGTGNHFIEICIDERDQVWLMLHSGSRGIGNRIGTYFIELAKRDMKKQIANLPDADLAYIKEGTEHFDDYLAAVSWAQGFAKANRVLMMQNTLAAFAGVLGRELKVMGLAIDCHHNYISREYHFGSEVIVTRKGAIRAGRGDLGIIPGSMGAKSFIVRGKGNAESFDSCAHGAGRTMSRTEAKRRFTAEDLASQTKGIECPKDKERVDEIPAAYKSIDAVMANQCDLVEIVHTLRQVVNVKG